VPELGQNLSFANVLTPDFVLKRYNAGTSKRGDYPNRRKLEPTMQWSIRNGLMQEVLWCGHGSSAFSKKNLSQKGAYFKKLERHKSSFGIINDIKN